jgi:hypothetical protein
LLDQIDLEADVVNYVGTVPRNRHNRNQVDERNAAASVIYERGLALFTGVEHSLQVRDSDIVRILALRTLDDLAIGTCV